MNSSVYFSTSDANSPTEEGGSKRGAVGPGGPGGVEMIFALLAEVVTVHVQLPEIQV